MLLVMLALWASTGSRIYWASFDVGPMSLHRFTCILGSLWCWPYEPPQGHVYIGFCVLLTLWASTGSRLYWLLCYVDPMSLHRVTCKLGSVLCWPYEPPHRVTCILGSVLCWPYEPPQVHVYIGFCVMLALWATSGSRVYLVPCDVSPMNPHMFTCSSVWCWPYEPPQVHVCIGFLVMLALWTSTSSCVY